MAKPSQGIHAMQLEMSQRVYMDEDRCMLVDGKLEKIRSVLKNMFFCVGKTLEEMGKREKL